MKFNVLWRLLKHVTLGDLRSCKHCNVIASKIFILNEKLSVLKTEFMLYILHLLK